MANRTDILQAAVQFIPTVLTSLIAGYAWPVDYEWKPTECLRIMLQTAATVDREIPRTTFSSVSDRRRLLYTGRPVDLRCTGRPVALAGTICIVSATSLRVGLLNWTIAWKFADRSRSSSSIGVGVTTADANYANEFDTTDGEPPAKRAIAWPATSNIDYVGDWPGLGFAKRRRSSDVSKSLVTAGIVADGYVDFAADPIRLQIRIVPDGNADDSFSITAATADEFWSCRPLVAVRDAVDVFIISYD